MLTLYITHSTCKMHEMGPGHPECPERLDAISDQMLASGLINYVQEMEVPAPVDDETLIRVHARDYIDRLQRMVPQQGLAEVDPDTMLNPYSLTAARHAAASGVLAVEEILGGRASTAFCAVRPPGHHAERAKSMGFCFFNNVAVAAAHALDRHGLERVAIIDFDVHHGNGTENIFGGDSRVLMCSFFQHPLYPNSGVENVADNMVNIPVPAYSRGDVIRKLVEEHWLPRLDAFMPQMIFISAGFDAHREDDLAQLGLVEDDYAWLTNRLLKVAQTHSAGRIVSMLEGGYNLSALGRSVVAHVKALAKL
ncbi:histone deacetylase family protein [Orrella marina]|uniref:Deacetylase n=1 Tax=Orrella marina TaxID=2163011 RepID=A0A2R4XJU3_9BURK|nr:histone deacetylase family protein [Orrella marina]AWB34034.1 deacetylase [Orrella marina]